MIVEELPSEVGEWELEQTTNDLVSYVALVGHLFLKSEEHSTGEEWLAYAEAQRVRPRGGRASWTLDGHAQPVEGKGLIEYRLYRTKSGRKSHVLDVLVDFIRDHKKEEQVKMILSEGHRTY